MSGNALHGPFAMPMFREFVPRKIQPWIFLLMAITFQLSGGMYMGAINQMRGEMSIMREDLLMCLYCSLGGMAIYFPFLFRAKFRFTNRTLLIAAALGVLICNLIAPYITFLPLLWLVCFISGVCKMQGTFECLSTIQLWITPKRDFTLFFPLLHIIIFTCMQFAEIVCVYILHHFHWTFMHWLIVGVMATDLLVFFICLRHFRFMRPLPLFGIDWVGWSLWTALLLLVTYFFNYGEYYDWLYSPIMRQVGVAIFLTLVVAVWRMYSIRHPFFEPKMWRYKNLFPVLGLITIVEVLMATEHVLEEIFYSEIMHYEEIVVVQLNWYAIIGMVGGCLFSILWLHIKHLRLVHFMILGFALLICSLVMFYLTIDSNINISQLYPITIIRGFAYAILSVALIICLEKIMTFQHFFQSLGVFQMLHLVLGGIVGSAIYSRAFAYLMAENVARNSFYLDHITISKMPMNIGGFMESFYIQMMEISIKQIYGWVLYATVFVFLLFLLFDMPMRRQIKNSLWPNSNKIT